MQGYSAASGSDAACAIIQRAMIIFLLHVCSNDSKRLLIARCRGLAGSRSAGLVAVVVAAVDASPPRCGENGPDCGVSDVSCSYLEALWSLSASSRHTKALKGFS